MPESNIILRISSAMGPGGLASLQAGIGMIGQLASGVAGAIKDLDKFSNVLRTVDMDMVSYADSAAKGQVDTMQLMQSLNQIKKAFEETGANITAEQFKTLAVRATELAQATGQDATQKFKELTDSISKGTTRALKEYGIYITQSTDLGKTHREALEMLTKGHEDLTVEIHTLTESLMEVSNNWGTFVSLAYAKATENTEKWGKATSGLNFLLTTLNQMMIDGKTNAQEYALSLQGILDKLFNIDEYNKRMLRATIADVNAANAADNQRGTQEAIDRAQAQIDALNGGTTKPKKRRGGGGGGRKSYDWQEGDIDTESGAWWWAEQTGNMPTSTEEWEAAQDEYDKMFGGSALDLESRTESGLFSDMDAAASELEDLIEEINDLEPADSAWVNSLFGGQDEKSEALQFADDFASAWEDAMGRVSAGTMAANAVMDVLHQTWNAAVESVIRGEEMTSEAIQTIVYEIGVAIAQEAGWHSLMEFAHAAAALASKQYDKAAEHATAGALYAALAVVAGVAAGAANPSSSAGSSYDSSGAGAGGGGGYSPSYGGDSGSGTSDVNITVAFKDNEYLDVLVEKNGRRVQSGQEGFDLAS